MQISFDIDSLIALYSNVTYPTYENSNEFKDMITKIYRYAVLKNYIELQTLCMQCLSNINSCWSGDLTDVESINELNIKLSYFYESIKNSLYAIKDIYYVPTFPPHDYSED